MQKYLLPTLFALAVAVGGAAFVFLRPEAAPMHTQTAAVSTSESQSVSAPQAPINAAPRQTPRECGQEVISICVEYRNTTYRFSLFHPSGQQVKVYNEGEGASTIVFEDIPSARGFQIFVVPYSGTQVSPDRFKRDEPSGVREDPVNVSIDGAFGTAFYSVDSFLGPTREVWFIHGGYLYEVTAPKSQDAMLGNSMLTWKFI